MSAEDELLGLSELAELLGVTRQTIANWRSRRRDFPEPIAVLKSGPIWTHANITSWAASNAIDVRNVPSEEHDEESAPDAAIVAIVNMKGGVGKSTLTANLGWFCAFKENMRILLVDLDPQFNLSQYVMGTDGYTAHLEAMKGTAVSLFEQLTPGGAAGRSHTPLEPTDIIASVKAWNDGSLIDIIPSSLDLAWTLRNPNIKDHLLAQFLAEIRSDYDLILIDCPPTDSMLTDAAYRASDSVLIPVKPEFLSTIGLPLVIRSLDAFEERFKDQVPGVLGIVFNATSDKLEHDRSRSYVANLAKENDWYMFENEVSYSDSYPKGSRMGTPIFLTDHARYWKVENFLSVANEFMTRIGS